MSSKQIRYVDENRAAVLLGLDREQLRRLSEQSGAGKTARRDGSEQRIFTYADLYRLCRLAVAASA